MFEGNNVQHELLLTTRQKIKLRNAGSQKKIHGSGTKTLIISNEEMNDIMKIVQALEDSNVLLKGITKTIENEKKQNRKENF